MAVIERTGSKSASRSREAKKPRSVKGSRRARRASIDDVAVAESEFRTPERPIVRRKFGEIMTGILLVLLGALAFLYFVGGDPSVPVVMMANDVPRGATVEAADLVQADVASTGTLAALRWEDAQSLVGQRATADLPAGSLPSWASVSAAPELPDGHRGVGVVLKVGPIPQLELAAGDVVGAIRVPPDEPPETIADAVVVKSSVPTVNEAEFFVTLIVPDEEVEAVSSAAQAGELRLVTVP